MNSLMGWLLEVWPIRDRLEATRDLEREIPLPVCEQDTHLLGARDVAWTRFENAGRDERWLRGCRHGPGA